VATVQQIWRYPAKSMVGEQLPTSPISTVGVVGDRGWAVRDEVRGGIRGAKKIAGLMRLSARYVSDPTGALPPPPIEIELPEGATVRSDDPDVHSRLSTALQHEVTLWPLQPADNLDHYRRGAPDSDDALVEVRAIFGRTAEEPLPDFSIFPAELLAEFESPPGTYFDAFPLHVVTTNSLRSLETLTPGSKADVRRFRPNVVIDAGDSDEPFPEAAWIGRTIRIGGAVLQLNAPCPRCVMITHAVADVPVDRALLRTVIQHADQNLGTYATVVTPGEIAVGDSLEFLDG
jgi:uncharacterized protein YcbX